MNKKIDANKLILSDAKLFQGEVHQFCIHIFSVIYAICCRAFLQERYFTACLWDC